jgi:hypothetical protein
MIYPCWLYLLYLIHTIPRILSYWFLYNRLLLVNILKINLIICLLNTLLRSPIISILRSLLFGIASNWASICITLHGWCCLSGKVLIFLLSKRLNWSYIFKTIRWIWMIIYFLMTSALSQLFISLHCRIYLQWWSVTVSSLRYNQALFLLILFLVL